MEVAILAVIFGSIFGVFYLFFSTRNKERLALIEKGADASIFIQSKRQAAPFWKILILNLGLLATGIGVGVLLGAVLSLNFAYDGPWETRPNMYIRPETFYIASVFICAGASLLVGFTITKRLDRE